MPRMRPNVSYTTIGLVSSSSSSSSSSALVVEGVVGDDEGGEEGQFERRLFLEVLPPVLLLGSSSVSCTAFVDCVGGLGFVYVYPYQPCIPLNPN